MTTTQPQHELSASSTEELRSRARGALENCGVDLSSLGTGPFVSACSPITGALCFSLPPISSLRPIRYIALLYTDLLRGTPALVQLFIIYFGLSDLGLEFDPVTAAIVGLGINGAAYVGEIYRAGIEAIHRGQLEDIQGVATAG